MASYDGPTGFFHPHDDTGRPVGDGSEGVHYPIGDDGEPDYSRPLRRNDANDGWRDAEDGEPTHFATFHENHVDIVPETGGEPITVTDAEAAAIRQMLEERRAAGE